MALDNFDLLQEIGKNGVYRLLFPQQEVGLAILELYRKIKNNAFQGGRFKEQDLHDALTRARFFDSTTNYERVPQLHFNNIISDLQVYFLRFDQDEQLYSFKDYADAFCRHAEATVRANFNPTEIERICHTLRVELEGCDTEQAFLHWLGATFDAFRPKMQLQVDQLERQIDISVKEIRATTQLEDTPLLEMLKAIDAKLDVIRLQNVELRAAFQEMKTVNRLISDKQSLMTQSAAHDLIAEVREFFPNIRYTLTLIDKRLDRIQPKIRQFFGMLNKPTFNVRVEKFLKLVLQRSQVLPDKTVVLPAEIPLHRLGWGTANFTMVERRNELFPVAPKRIMFATDPPDQHQPGLQQVRRRMVYVNRTITYLDHIIAEAKISSVSFSTYFFSIMQEHNDLELATLVADQLIRLAAKDHAIQIERTTLRVGHPAFPKVYIWEMNIQYQA